MNTQELKKYIDRVLGNKIRCLLPSYWWKRLFNLVVDRVDEVEQNSKIPIVTSENELNKLNLPEGSLASVSGVKKMKFSECYQLSSTDNDLELEDLAKKLTIVKEIGVNFPLPTFTTEHNATYRIYNLNGNQISGGVFILIDGVDYKVVYTNEADSESEEFLIKSQSDIDRINDILGSGDFYYIGLENNGLESENVKIIDTAFYVVSDSISATAYIKGEYWEQLAKVSDLEDGGSGDGLVFGVERCAYVSRERVESGNITETELTDEQIAYNIETVSLLASGEKVYLSHDGTFWMKCGYDISNSKTTYYFSAVSMTLMSSNKLWGRMMAVSSDGSIDIVNTTVGGSSITVDSELSTSSTNPVQNKVITAALNNKADKTYVDNAVANVTVDTSGLATKEELNNAIATSITNILNTEV